MSLSKFVTEFDSTIKFEIPDDEVAGVEELVKNFILSVLDKIKEKDDRFDVSSLIPAGSFYEGTRVSHVPNEFDYMVELSKLSSNVTVEPGCNGYARVKLAEKVDCKMWKEFCCDGFLMPENYFEVVGKENEGDRIMDKFYKLVLENVHANKTQTCTGPFGQLELERMQSSPRGGIEFIFMYNNCSDSKLFEKDRPTSWIVNVDIIPVIGFKDVEQIDQFKRHFPNDAKDVIQPHPCFLIPKSCTMQQEKHTCWRFTFSRQEMILIRDLDVFHKSCYRVLKSIYIQTKDHLHTQGHVCSNTLKTAMLHHASRCNKTTNECSKDCLLEVLGSLMTNCQENFLPSYFDPGLNTFGCVIGPEDNEGKETGDVKFLSERRNHIRIVSLICRKFLKTPVLHVNWGLFISKLLEIVKGLLTLVSLTPEHSYNFALFRKWVEIMNAKVLEFFEPTDEEEDVAFLHRLYIRTTIDQDMLLGVSELIESIETEIDQQIPISRVSLRAQIRHIRENELISLHSIPPLWYAVNLSLSSEYSEPTWRTYTKKSKYLGREGFKANAEIGCFNKASSSFKPEDILLVAGNKAHSLNATCSASTSGQNSDDSEDEIAIQPGEEIYIKFGSITGPYDTHRAIDVRGETSSIYQRQTDSSKKRKRDDSE